MSLKYALHHLSPGGIFLYLTSLSYIISLLGCAISQLWNLNHIISLLSGAVSHHVSKIWTMSPSSSIWSWCCIIFSLRACPCNVKVLAAFFSHLQGFVGISLHPQSPDVSSWNFKVLLASPCIFKVLMRAPCNVKVLAAFFLKLQGFVGISKILMRSPCIFKSLVGISKILMSGYSAMYLWCLNFIAFENWC